MTDIPTRPISVRVETPEEAQVSAAWAEMIEGAEKLLDALREGRVWRHDDFKVASVMIEVAESAGRVAAIGRKLIRGKATP